MNLGHPSGRDTEAKTALFGMIRAHMESSNLICGGHYGSLSHKECFLRRVVEPKNLWHQRRHRRKTEIDMAVKTEADQLFSVTAIVGQETDPEHRAAAED